MVTSLLLLLLTIVTHTVSKRYAERFDGVVLPDQIVYVTISIPKYANRVTVTIGIEDTPVAASALLRYNGLPTPNENDRSIALPKSPELLEIVDSEPTSSTLFIGIWGGELLDSYRYFAGGPLYTAFVVESEFITCDSALHRGDTCEPVQLLPLMPVKNASAIISNVISHSSTIGDSIVVNTMKAYALYVPVNTLQFTTTLLLENGRDLLCSRLFKPEQSNGVVEIFVDVFYDQPLEDLNAGRSSIFAEYQQFCTASSLEIPLNLELVAQKPLSGLWTVTVQILYNDNSSRLALLELPFTLQTSLLACEGNTCGSIDNDIPTQIASLETYRTNKASFGELVLYSTENPSLRIGVNSTAAQFSGVTDRLQPSASGGGLLIRMKISPADIEDEDFFVNFIKKMSTTQFIVSLRFGGFCIGVEDFRNDLKHTKELADQNGNGFTVTSNPLEGDNQLTLSTINADVVDKRNHLDHVYKSKDPLTFNILANLTRDISDEIVYEWYVSHPLLTRIKSTGAGEIEKEKLYVRVEQEESGIATSHSIRVSMKVSFTPCIPNRCANGECVINRAGDIPYASCKCRYAIMLHL